MYRLLGPHVNYSPGGIPELIIEWQPPVCLVLNPEAVWQGVVNACPRTRFVWRWISPDPDFNQDMDPVQAARDFCAWQLRLIQPWMATGWIQGTNETVLSSREAMDRYAGFEIERTRILANHGYKAALASFAVGNPPDLSWWYEFIPALETGKEHSAILLLHEYNWDKMLTSDAEWYSLRHRKVYEGEPSHGWAGLSSDLRLPLVIGETGWDIGARQPGVIGSWRGHAEDWQYAADLDGYSKELERDSYVLGACIFCCPNYPGDGWFLYSIWPDPAQQIARDAVPLYRQLKPPVPSEAQGLDVSVWQGKFCWYDAMKAGKSFGMIRSSIGLWEDKQWERNWRRAGKYDILRCSYHFLKANVNVRDQARFAVSLVKQRPVEMGLYVDIEHDTAGNIPNAEQVKAFSEIVTNSYQGPYGIYTSAYQWSVGPGPGQHWAGEYLLCVADWGGLDAPRLPGPWDEWELWQWTNRGRLCGKRIDLQKAAVSEGELRAKYG